MTPFHPQEDPLDEQPLLLIPQQVAPFSHFPQFRHSGCARRSLNGALSKRTPPKYALNAGETAARRLNIPLRASGFLAPA